MRPFIYCCRSFTCNGKKINIRVLMCSFTVSRNKQSVIFTKTVLKYFFSIEMLSKGYRINKIHCDQMMRLFFKIVFQNLLFCTVYWSSLNWNKSILNIPVHCTSNTVCQIYKDIRIGHIVVVIKTNILKTTSILGKVNKYDIAVNIFQYQLFCCLCEVD